MDNDINDINYCFSYFVEEKDLHIPIDNDDWIVRFLRPCKFYPHSARDLVSLIDNFSYDFDRTSANW